ncbi:DUF397 domain-containing protein [Streptomyces cinereoruber]|uniref:DUF397 domain-containing protein n=1 Tax=Streptomyces cinereoruber TaxID=67260 RepID=UPI0036434921
MKDADLTGAVWRKSSYSNGQAECVETAVLPDGGRAVRDSKDKSGPILRFTPGEWRAFIVGARAGEFD